MGDNLKNKAVRGVGWSATDALLVQGINFIVGLVLANKLGPHEYGLIGYVSIFIALFNCIVNSGFSNALIRKKGCQRCRLQHHIYHKHGFVSGIERNPVPDSTNHIKIL